MMFAIQMAGWKELYTRELLSAEVGQGAGMSGDVHTESISSLRVMGWVCFGALGSSFSPVSTF